MNKLKFPSFLPGNVPIFLLILYWPLALVYSLILLVLYLLYLITIQPIRYLIRFIRHRKDFDCYDIDPKRRFKNKKKGAPNEDLPIGKKEFKNNGTQ